MNDLENDDQYNYWPRQLQEVIEFLTMKLMFLKSFFFSMQNLQNFTFYFKLLRPTFPGMLRYIAKNIFHAVLYMNPMDEGSIKTYLDFEDLIENSVPVR